MMGMFKASLNKANLNPSAVISNKSIAAVEKAIKPGIKVTEPRTEASKIPQAPDFSPIILLINSVSIIESIKPIRKITPKSKGMIFLKEFQAFIKAFFVFCLLFINEIIKNIIATRYMAPLKI